MRTRQIWTVLSRDNLKCLPGVQSALDETLPWLVEAVAFEELHGVVSMHNTKHPKWLAAKEV